jgi:hypothetical protein
VITTLAFLAGLASGWGLSLRARSAERARWAIKNTALHAENVALRRVALEPEPDDAVADCLRTWMRPRGVR